MTKEPVGFVVEVTKGRRRGIKEFFFSEWLAKSYLIKLRSRYGVARKEMEIYPLFR